jgi:hypothetical protein
MISRNRAVIQVSVENRSFDILVIPPFRSDDLSRESPAQELGPTFASLHAPEGMRVNQSNGVPLLLEYQLNSPDEVDVLRGLHFIR